MFEDVLLTVETENLLDGSIVLNGRCNRFDRTGLMITCIGESGQTHVFETTTMYGGYELILDPGELPGGVYDCLISDDSGNWTEIRIEVPHGVS